MALSSASTIDEIRAAYDDNASYEEDGDVTKARAFITACRMMIGHLPTQSVQGPNNSISLGIDLIAKQLDAAKKWLIDNDTSTRNGGPTVTQLTMDGGLYNGTGSGRNCGGSF